MAVAYNCSGVELRWLREYYKVPDHISDSQVDRYVEVLQAKNLKFVVRDLEERIEHVHATMQAKVYNL